MLPLVGLAAIGLLLVAGKIFLSSEFQASSDPIPVAIAPPDVSRADVGEASLEGQLDNLSEISRQRVAAGGNLILDLDQDGVGTAPTDAISVNSVASDVAPESLNPNGTLQVREEIIIATPDSARPDPEPQPGLELVVAPIQPEQVQPERATAQPSRAIWRVQIGAYSTRAAAEAVVRRVTQAGYTAAVVSGRTWYRVLVQAGSTRQDAVNLAAHMGRGGYPGAFVVPP